MSKGLHSIVAHLVFWGNYYIIKLEVTTYAI